MELRINYAPQLVPIMRQKKLIERQVRENRAKQQELRNQEKDLLKQQAVMDAFIKHPKEMKENIERYKGIIK